MRITGSPLLLHRSTSAGLVTVLLLFLAVLAGCASRPEDRARDLTRRAETAWAERRFAAALAFWEEAYSLTPQDAALALRLAHAYGHRFQWEKGLALCRDVLDRDSRHVEAWRTTALLTMASGRMDEALLAVEVLKRLDPQGAVSQSLYGDFLLLQGDAKGALQSYQAALESLNSEESSPADLSAKGTFSVLPRRGLQGVVQAKEAACLMALGRGAEALHLVENLTATAQAEPGLWAHLGRLWELLGDTDQPARAYEAAYEADPGDLSPMLRRIRLALEANRPKEATAALDRLEQAGAPPEVIGKLRVEEALRQGRLDEAARVLETLKARGIGDTEVRLMEAKIRLLEDRPVAALLILEKILDLEPHIPTAHYLAGLAHLRANHVRLAQRSMIRALELNPRFTEARVILVVTHYKLREMGPAQAHAQALAEREPENPDARTLLALCAAETGAVEEAARHVQALRLLNADPRRILTAQTQVLEYAGETAQAAKTALLLWDTLPSEADAAWSAVRLACRTGHDKEARSRLERARDHGPPSAVFQVLMGDVALCSGRKEEARAAYERALELNPGSASAYRGLTRCEKDSEITLQKILGDFRTHVPDSVEPVTALADLAFRKGDTVAARKILEQGRDAHPDSGILANNLAWIYLESDDCPDKALALAQRAYDLLPERVEVLDTLGYAYFRKGLTTRALWYLGEARARAPQDAMVAYHLGLLYATQGDSEHARLHLEEALRLGLPDREASHAAAMLADLS